MPQLDTIFILTVFLWTWLTLHLITQKITILTMTTGPKNQDTMTNKPTINLPWM
uniref:ATP synthase F0 subunit 8 n=1 Tax=Plagiopholis styani TaxID=527806 RepID=UPI001BEE4208|nr:ATP synthase F0 subunit 8 [Plagiopholis styani]QTZ98241.1 ATP synthase F0 subunit 8 [Plagiopholis styani]